MSKPKNYGKSKRNKKKRNRPAIQHISGADMGMPDFPGFTTISRQSEIINKGTEEDYFGDKTFAETEKELSNMDFTETRVIRDRVFRDTGGILSDFVKFVKNDLKEYGKVAPYYFYHASAEKIGIDPMQAVDNENMFVRQMEEMKENAEKRDIPYFTETNIFENLKINGLTIARLELKAFISESVAIDPMPMQFGIQYTSGVNTYLKIELN